MKQPLTIMNDTIDTTLALFDYEPEVLASALAKDSEALEDLQHHICDLLDALNLAQSRVI